MDDSRLTPLRAKIDELDVQILALLSERAKVAIEIGKLKEGEVYDPAREDEVLQHIVAKNPGPLPKGSLEEVYAAIITACREIQISSS